MDSIKNETEFERFEMKFKSNSLSDVGRKRSTNQDSLFEDAEKGLFIVADGMGGHKGGETASALAVETISAELSHTVNGQDRADKASFIRSAVATANEKIFRTSHENPELQGMGTTVTVLLFCPNGLSIGHVGDSRAYLIRNHSIWQLTRDHSLVQEKLKAGIITRDQLKTDKMKNVITRSVGFQTDLQVDVYDIDFQKGDLFLLCSDGLTGPVSDQNIKGIIQDRFFGENNLKGAVSSLIEAANENGGDDNVSAILVEVVEGM